MNERLAKEAGFSDEGELYRLMVDSALDIVAAIHPDGTILSLNPAFEVISGWRRQDWIGKSFHALVHPDDRAREEATFAALRRGEGPFPVELRLLSRSGISVEIESALP